MDEKLDKGVRQEQVRKLEQIQKVNKNKLVLNCLFMFSPSIWHGVCFISGIIYSAISGEYLPEWIIIVTSIVMFIPILGSQLISVPLYIWVDIKKTKRSKLAFLIVFSILNMSFFIVSTLCLFLYLLPLANLGQILFWTAALIMSIIHAVMIIFIMNSTIKKYRLMLK
jgi:hypothetical protein